MFKVKMVNPWLVRVEAAYKDYTRLVTEMDKWADAHDTTEVGDDVEAPLRAACNAFLDTMPRDPDYVYNSQKVPLIKFVRSLTGLGLKDAKDWVELHYQARLDEMWRIANGEQQRVERVSLGDILKEQFAKG